MTEASARGDGGVLALAAFAAGCAFLLARQNVRDVRDPAVVLALGYALVISVAAEAPAAPTSERAPLRPAAVLAVGVAAVLACTLLARPRVSLPSSASAVALNSLAAVAEEALFRRLAYAWLARRGVAIAVAGTALAFALVHVPAYGAEIVPVDLGAGLLLSWQRAASGTWSVPAATHVFANLLAVIA